MNTMLGAIAFSLFTITVGIAPAGAQDINIYVHGEEGTTFGHGSDGEGHDQHMRGRGEHHRGGHGMHHGRGHHGLGPGPDHGKAGTHHGRDHGGRMGRRRGVDRVLRLIELYDLDQDERVTQAEINQARNDRLAEFDSDGNGTLSLREYELLWLDAMRERMVDRFQSHDDDGLVTVEEFSKRTSYLVMRRDRNQDGAISLDDIRRDNHGNRAMRDRNE